MPELKIGESIIATLPNCNPISNLYIVKITKELITCTYVQNKTLITVDLLPEWVSKPEEIESGPLPMVFS